MIKKLSVLLVVIAASIFAYGAAMTAFAEEGSSNVSINSEASITIGDNDRDDDKNDWDKDNEVRGEWRGDAEVRAEHKEDMRKDRANWWNIFRARKAEFKEEMRSEMKQTRRGLIEARWKMLGARFENVIIRIESRIEKMEAEGKATAAAQVHVANAKESLKDAQAKAIALAESIEDKILDKEAVMKAGAEIKADLEAAKVELKLAMRVLADLNAESKDKGDDNE